MNRSTVQTLLPEQVAKLPQWAQKHIDNLHMRLMEVVQAFDEINGPPTPICVDPYSDHVRYLPEGSKVQFQIGGEQIQVQADHIWCHGHREQVLAIHSTQRLLITPASSNVAHVKTDTVQP